MSEASSLLKLIFKQRDLQNRRNTGFNVKIIIAQFPNSAHLWLWQTANVLHAVVGFFVLCGLIIIVKRLTTGNTEIAQSTVSFFNQIQLEIFKDSFFARHKTSYGTGDV